MATLPGCILPANYDATKVYKAAKRRGAERARDEHMRLGVMIVDLEMNLYDQFEEHREAYLEMKRWYSIIVDLESILQTSTEQLRRDSRMLENRYQDLLRRVTTYNYNQFPRFVR